MLSASTTAVLYLFRAVWKVENVFIAIQGRVVSKVGRKSWSASGRGVPRSLPAGLSRVCLLPCTLPVQLSASSCTPLMGLVACRVIRERDHVSAVFVHLPAPQNSDL